MFSLMVSLAMYCCTTRVTNASNLSCLEKNGFLRCTGNKCLTFLGVFLCYAFKYDAIAGIVKVSSRFIAAFIFTTLDFIFGLQKSTINWLETIISYLKN